VAFASPSTDDVEIVERLSGGSGTEFGVPGEAARAEDEAVDDAALRRLTALLRAAWAAFDSAADAARGVRLTTGPRGGGRTLARMTTHVLEAELAYLGQLGSRPPVDRSLASVRDAFIATLEARVHGDELPNPRRTKRPWSPRYAVRRSAWHSLDHAWDLEDRSSR
jgi:hypothetical protein